MTSDKVKPQVTAWGRRWATRCVSRSRSCSGEETGGSRSLQEPAPLRGQFCEGDGDPCVFGAVRQATCRLSSAGRRKKADAAGLGSSWRLIAASYSLRTFMLQTVARSAPCFDKSGHSRERITCSRVCPACNKRLPGHLAEKTCTISQKRRSQGVMPLLLELIVGATGWSKSCSEFSDA